MKKPVRDFKGFAHSLFYLIGLAKKQEPGGGEKYYGRQRMVYLALAYGIGLIAISGMFMYYFTTEGILHSVFKLTHIMAASLVYLVLLYHFAINLRSHDRMELRCSFLTGTLPLWHIKQNHKIWYREIRDHEKRVAIHEISKNNKKPSDPVAATIMKMAELENLFLPRSIAEKLADRFREENSQKDVDDFIRTSKMF